MTESSNQEIVKHESKSLMAAIEHQGENSFEGDPSDILIPKLLIGQAISEVVQQSLVGNGEIYKSTTKQVVGGNGKPFPFIPLTMRKIWNLYQEKDGVMKYKGVEPFTAVNANDPWDWVDEENKKWKRVKALEFFGLIPYEIDDDLQMRKDLEESGDLPDLDKALLPCLLSFQSTSFNEGKTLVTHFAKAAEFNVPGYSNYFLIDTELKKGDKGRYGVFKVGKGGKTLKEHVESCRKWKATVSSKAVKVDEGEEFEIVNATPGGAAPLEANPQF